MENQASLLENSRIIFKYDSTDRVFKREIKKSQGPEETNVIGQEDLYWLEKETVDLNEAKEFLEVAYSWEKRFPGFITIEADVDPIVFIKLGKVESHSHSGEIFLTLDIKWLFLPDMIENLSSKMGYVAISGELFRGVSPSLFENDLMTSGKKVLTTSRLRSFLENEWPYLRSFTVTEDKSLASLLVPLYECRLTDDTTKGVKIGTYHLPHGQIPELFERYGLFTAKEQFFYGDQLHAAGIRLFGRSFTGERLFTATKSTKKPDTSGVFPITNSNSWYKYASFQNTATTSDVFLAGDREFTFLAGQKEYAPISQDEVLDVIKRIKEISTLKDPNLSYESYRNWQQEFLETKDPGQNPIYCFVFMQSLANGLFESTAEKKLQIFWLLWQTISNYATRELKGEFIDIAIDWSLIEYQFGIYGYMSTLKYGYLHNALLWQAFLPENRDYLDPEYCAGVANVSLSGLDLTGIPELPRIISIVFGKIDDFYREKTGISILANFHPGHYVKRISIPFKNQVYAGFVGKLYVDELTPIVFHKPLVSFSKAVFETIVEILAGKQKDTANRLPKQIETLIIDTVSSLQKML